MSDVNTLIPEMVKKMDAAIVALERDFAGYRTGKASPALVENLMVDYYGTKTKLKELAGINTPEPRLIVIQPWDQSAVAEIEKAIIASDIGISPVNDGRVIRLPVPDLSEERRKDLTKQIKKRSEEEKVTIRNHRRDANEEVKKFEKDSDITEDDMHIMLDDIQKKTDLYIGKVDKLTDAKEKELMEI